MQCPYCHHTIAADDLFCPNCGQEVYSATHGDPAAKDQGPPPLPDEPPTTLAARGLVGKKCPYCQCVINSGDEVIVCPDCDTPHHVDCWRENEGCTTFGCAGGPQTPAITVEADPAPPRPGFQPAYGPTAPEPEKPALAVAIAAQERKALTALILSLLGFTCCPISSIIGLVLAWQVYTSQNNTNVSGAVARARATWAMVLGLVALLIWFIMLVVAMLTNP